MNYLDKVLNRITEILIREYKPEKIILFGSYASGKPTQDSDIDLLIVKRTEKSFFQRLVAVRRLTSEVRKGYAFEPLVLTPEELKERLDRGDQFIQEVVERGKLIYEK